MTASGFNPPPPDTAPPIRKTPVLTGDKVEFQHQGSKDPALFLSKFGQWYRVGGHFNRDMLPPQVGAVPFPHKIVPVAGKNGKAEGDPLASGDWVRIRTTQNMPPPNLTMIGVTSGQNWSLCKHWGDALVQFYFTEDEASEWQIHRVAGPGTIHYGDTVRLQKHSKTASEAGWLKRTDTKGGNEFYADLEHKDQPSSSANWIIYPQR